MINEPDAIIANAVIWTRDFLSGLPEPLLLSDYTIPVLLIFVVLGLFRIGAMLSSIKSILIGRH